MNVVAWVVWKVAGNSGQHLSRVHKMHADFGMWHSALYTVYTVYGVRAHRAHSLLRCDRPPTNEVFGEVVNRNWCPCNGHHHFAAACYGEIVILEKKLRVALGVQQSWKLKSLTEEKKKSIKTKLKNAFDVRQRKTDSDMR